MPAQLLPIPPSASLAEQAFQRLAEAIEAGVFPPGSTIREAAVARQLGISRAPLREAMVRLAGLKVVERVPNIGVRVVALSEADLRDLFTVREALEGIACGQAATRISDEEIARISAIYQRQTQAFESGDEIWFYGQQDQDFHQIILHASGSPRLISALRDELYYQLRMYRSRSSRVPGRAAQVLEEHGAIVEALKLRDPQKSEAAMRRHISAAVQNLVWLETDKQNARNAG